MSSETFSERYGLRLTRRPKVLIYKKVPSQVKAGLFPILDTLMLKYAKFQYIAYGSVFPNYRQLYEACRRKLIITQKQVITLDDEGLDYAHAELIFLLLETCVWYEFLDAVEAIYECSQESEHAEEFAKEINILFETNRLGYRLKAGRMECIGSPFSEEVKEKARTLLQGPRFKGPMQEWDGALKHLNHRPEPECDDCAHDAVGALEGVARILTKKPKAILSDLLREEPLRSIIPTPLHTAYEKLNAYRGNEPGVAHGLTESSRVGVAEAELVLGLCGNMILYLVAKFNSKGQG